MRIDNSSSLFTPEQIALFEKKQNAKYVFESCVRGRDGGYVDKPVAVFYQEVAHPRGSNYFGLYYQIDTTTIYDSKPSYRMMICNALSATEPFEGMVLPDGLVVYSRYQHDYRTWGDYMVDGGREYLRMGFPQGELLPPQSVLIGVEKDKLVVLEVRDREVLRPSRAMKMMNKNLLKSPD